MMAGLCFLVGFALGLVGPRAVELLESINASSRVAAVSKRVMENLAAHYDRFQRYPERLSELSVDYSHTDGGTTADLAWIRYSSDGASYTLVRLGPGRELRDIWWCAGNDRCGHSALE